MKRLLWLLLLLCSAFASAQVVGPGFVDYVTSAPSGTCSQGQHQQNVLSSGNIYTCQSGTWTQANGGGASGISGTLTATRIPVASAAHTLVNGTLTDDGAGTIGDAIGGGLLFSTPDSSFGIQLGTGGGFIQVATNVVLDIANGSRLLISQSAGCTAFTGTTTQCASLQPAGGTAMPLALSPSVGAGNKNGGAIWYDLSGSKGLTVEAPDTLSSNRNIGWPDASGTVAVSATSPVALSAAGAVSINANGITASQLATQYAILRCYPGLGDGLNAITAGTYLQTNCYNNSGVTWTITRIGCFTDNAGSSTLNATNGAATALLTGAVTCGTGAGGTAGTQSATVTIANGDVIKFTFVADGTSKQTGWFVTLTQ